ncbi:hypothetical protein IAT38_000225 [Cryptococcus sp. DSM 104549]
MSIPTSPYEGPRTSSSAYHDTSISTATTVQSMSVVEHALDHGEHPHEYPHSHSQQGYPPNGQATSDVDMDEKDFDPMAPVERFDSRKELEDKWDEIQKEMVPFLQNFAHDALATTYDTILQVHYIFHQLNVDAQKSLVQGAEAIEAEERKQEDARKVITDFSNEMKRAAEVLKKFGGGNLLRGITQ